MIDYLIALDTDVFLWLHSHHTIYWDLVMKMASSKLIWIPMYVALLFAYCKAYTWRNALTLVILTALAVTIADQISASVIRPFFERMRPSNPDNPLSQFVIIVDGYRSGKYGFPSCHAANTFALVTFTSLIFKRWKYFLFIMFWALINCYSRIYLGVHYPGDIVVGMTIGAIAGGICYFLGNLVARTYHLRQFIHKEKLNRSFIAGKMVSYLPSNFVIAVGLLTIIFILIYGAVKIII
ncbi:MAG: phosphatase PAP2 family protein [Bacteroides sp.]|nr:phosphatase PAP2 family protein [Bacteroides sp.]